MSELGHFQPVVPVHSRLKNGVASLALCRGYPRLKNAAKQDVDGRSKSGHDEPLVSFLYYCPAPKRPFEAVTSNVASG
jgi:hypothetical protein